ncbi:MAG: tetratricopeptide repeat protein [Nitrospinae bacterium]|nr:tetratricopeptide repeat protein [Nitrospinota bacterium]MBL7021607.1 tetratricopeptide repeat protein [Nitrospinaceae bacterium]
MKTDTVYKGIRYIGIGLIFASLGWAFYKGTGSETHPGGLAFSQAVGFYTDGKYEDALQYYETSIIEHPDFIHAKRGRARTLMQLGRDLEALEAFNEVLEQDPGSAVSFANRGILQDRMGLYPQAIADYDKAIKMDPHLGEGLDWFTRLLQDRKEKPQTLTERLQTLRKATP